MQKYLLMGCFILGLSIGIGIGGLLSFKLLNNKMIEYKKRYNRSRRDNVDLKLRYEKTEKELEERRNEFQNKYIDDGYEEY